MPNWARHGIVLLVAVCFAGYQYSKTVAHLSKREESLVKQISRAKGLVARNIDMVDHELLDVTSANRASHTLIVHRAVTPPVIIGEISPDHVTNRRLMQKKRGRGGRGKRSGRGGRHGSGRAKKRDKAKRGGHARPAKGRRNGMDEEGPYLKLKLYDPKLDFLKELFEKYHITFPATVAAKAKPQGVKQQQPKASASAAHASTVKTPKADGSAVAAAADPVVASKPTAAAVEEEEATPAIVAESDGIEAVDVEVGATGSAAEAP